MTKEMLISSSPHETKIALLEDDQVVEVYYERDTDVGLVGGIYKGRVSRVLPGMQSAFVNIGLERDAFLYVSDFFEDSDEYDRIFTEAENRVARLDQEGGTSASPAAGAVEFAPQAAATPAEVADVPSIGPQDSTTATPAPAAPDAEAAAASSGNSSPQASNVPPPTEHSEAYHRGFHGQGRRRRGRRFGGHRFGGHKPEFLEPSNERLREERHQGLELLPGESLAKYGHAEASPSPVEETSVNVQGSDFEEGQNALASSPSFTGSGEARDTQSGESAPTAAQEPPEPQDNEREPIAAVGAPPPTREAGLTARHPEDEEVNQKPLRSTSRQESSGAAVQLEAQAFSPQRDSAAGSTLDGQEVPTPAGEEHPDLNHPSEAEITAHHSLFAEESEAGYADDFESPPEGGKTLETPGDALEPGSGAVRENEAENLNSHAPEAENAARSFTLREPHQRPRFAPRRPRRGRGRFGQHGLREGGRQNEAPRAGNFQPVQINEVLKEGQEILVQIAKEPLGTKGARITSHIALPGRYLVYMPTINHIGVSRKISSDEERSRLRRVIQENRGGMTGGIIVRTAAAGRNEEELKADLQFLGSLWNDIRAKAEQSKAPALIHRDLNVVQRILRDLLSPDFKTILIDNEIEFEQVVDFVNRCQPSLVGHVRLYTRDVPLFEEFGVQQEIDKALKPKVWLKSGGYIVINQTEALVSIDVNTGKYVGKTNRLEDTIVKVNIDAVKEIVRQIRIRDLGGIIVIDFIDMDDRRNRNKVVQALEEALRADRAPTKILSFNEFGLVALTRKRVKQSLERTLCEPCPYCSGAGWVKSPLTVSYEIVAEAHKMASQIEGKVMTLRVHPEVARALKSRDSVLLSEIENATHKEIVIKSDPLVQQERFEIF
jgi:ribonuclease G